MTFDEVMTQAALHGLLLNQFHQLPTGEFRCNFRTQDGARFSTLVENDNPLWALTTAWKMAAKDLVKNAPAVVHEAPKTSCMAEAVWSPPDTPPVWTPPWSA